MVYPPFTEAFPLDTLEALRAFVADGGTLVDFGGAPMWYAYRDGRPADTLPGGGLAREAAWDALRVSVVFPGRESGIPAKATVHATPEALAAGMPDDMNGWPCHRFFDAAKHGVERFLIYALRNSERNPHDREDHFGIVHADFSPKPAFLMLRQMR